MLPMHLFVNKDPANGCEDSEQRTNKRMNTKQMVYTQIWVEKDSANQYEQPTNTYGPTVCYMCAKLWTEHVQINVNDKQTRIDKKRVIYTYICRQRTCKSI